MTKFLRFSLFVVFISNASFGQQSATKHTVLKGETIDLIAQNYKTTPSEIYRLNPEAQNGISENQMLQVPELLPQNSNSITHIVAPKETLFGLAVKYNTKVETIQNANASILANGLQVGQELVIPQESKTETVTSKNTHLVQSKESLFSIARLYNVSVEDLYKINTALLKNGLQIGQEITIPNKKKTLDGRVRVINEETVFYVVKPKETKYSIAKQFGITIEQLESQNPEIINGLVEGNKLAINVNGVTASNESEELMLALAEKQVVVEKSKADTKEINSLKDKLELQQEINQRVVRVNGLLVDLKEFDNTKESSAEKLRLVLEANKNIQEILLVKLDSLVNTMNKDLIELKKTELVDLDESVRLQKISNENIQKTNALSQQLKKELSENRKLYSNLMSKAERIVVEENQQYKKSIRENSKIKPVEAKVAVLTPAELTTMEMQQKVRDLNTIKMIKRLDSLNNESKAELRLHISKADFYSKQARTFDDNLAKLKNKSYQNKASESQTKTNSSAAVKPLTFDEIKKELAKQPAKVKAIRLEKVEGVKDLKQGYYVVLGSFQDATERDVFFRKLTDSGSLEANFFYNINVLSYYVYSKVVTTLEEAQYECMQQEGKPLYEKMFIANVISDN